MLSRRSLLRADYLDLLNSLLLSFTISLLTGRTGFSKGGRRKNIARAHVGALKDHLDLAWGGHDRRDHLFALEVTHLNRLIDIALL